mmetsp:Transcript_61507/g.199049  ORF Transcript_61507/g.199049 Transcript_61507/m.199049 type:complete len:218 (-) Transcript_61507:234-887(-)
MSRRRRWRCAQRSSVRQNPSSSRLVAMRRRSSRTRMSMRGPGRSWPGVPQRESQCRGKGSRRRRTSMSLGMAPRSGRRPPARCSPSAHCCRRSRSGTRRMPLTRRGWRRQRSGRQVGRALGVVLLGPGSSVIGQPARSGRRRLSVRLSESRSPKPLTRARTLVALAWGRLGTCALVARGEDAAHPGQLQPGTGSLPRPQRRWWRLWRLRRRCRQPSR